MSTTHAGVDPREIRRLYEEGKNVMEYLRSLKGSATNDPFTILASYDLQAGTYVHAIMEDPEFAHLQAACTAKFATLFDRLSPDSILEVGVGEATTLANVLDKMKRRPATALGFDISLSRVLVARKYAASVGQHPVLFTGTLESVPLEDNSVDVVYTSHSMEPNGGREREILAELYRVARRYLVLREPSNELGSEATQTRMRQHGYVRDLHATALSLGYEVIEHTPWELNSNPLNEAALMVIRKPAFDAPPTPDPPKLASPIGRKALVPSAEALYSAEDCLVFPVLAGIPCLLPENGVFCIRWQENISPT